jgi:hypothetical protein
MLYFGDNPPNMDRQLFATKQILKYIGNGDFTNNKNEVIHYDLNDTNFRYFKINLQDAMVNKIFTFLNGGNTRIRKRRNNTIRRRKRRNTKRN